MTTPGHDHAMRLYDDILRQYHATLPSLVGSPRTAARYTSITGRAHRQLPHGVIVADEPELRAWLWGDQRAERTVAQRVHAIRHLHRWLARHDITTLDPTEDIHPPTPPRALPRPAPAGAVARLLAEASDPTRRYSWIMAYTGARCCEVANLDTRDITSETVRLFGKGRRERAVPTHPALWAEVQQWEPGPLVPGRWPDPAGLVSARVARQCRRLGLAITAHQLRHAVATDTLDRTGDLRLVQELLGHASPATTAIYTRVSGARLRAAVEGLGWVAP